MLKMIKACQGADYYGFPRLPFFRLLRNITEKFEPKVTNAGGHMKWTMEAVLLMQKVTEDFMTSTFGDAASAANHRDRITVVPKDFEFVCRMRAPCTWT